MTLRDVDLTTEEAARRLGCNRATVYRLMKSGELDNHKRLGRRLIPSSAVTALLERRTGRLKTTAEEGGNNAGT